MIPLELWHAEEMRKRRENAVAKALREKPTVVHECALEVWNYYRVGDRYTVGLYYDPDKQGFIECSCAAGKPPIDEATGLPSREPMPCYHAATVLIYLAEKEQA